MVVKDPARAELFHGIFDEDRIPLKANKLTSLNSGEYCVRDQSDRMFYFGDMGRMSSEQVQEIARRIASPGHDAGEVLEDFEKRGLPILLEKTEPYFCNLHTVKIRDLM